MGIVKLEKSGFYIMKYEIFFPAFLIFLISASKKIQNLFDKTLIIFVM